MKKRSLFAAVAMLIVSALVLTSSTYAWFAKKSSASVEKLAASVSNTGGSLQVSATGNANTWKDTLLANEIVYEGNTTLTPADADVATSSITFRGCDYTGSSFSSASAGNILHYTWYVKSDKSADIYLHPQFAGTAPVYGAVKVNNAVTVYGSASATYKSFSADLPNTNESGTYNGIVDDNEAPTTTWLKTVTPTGDGSLMIPSSAVTANTAIAVEVWVWAEGQDAACTGTDVNVSSAGFTFGPSYTA